MTITSFAGTMAATMRAPLARMPIGRRERSCSVAATLSEVQYRAGQFPLWFLEDSSRNINSLPSKHSHTERHMQAVFGIAYVFGLVLSRSIDLQSVRDIGLDETVSLYHGIRMFADGAVPAEDSPLYQLWYWLQSLIINDRVDLYYFNCQSFFLGSSRITVGLFPHSEAMDEETRPRS